MQQVTPAHAAAIAAKSDVAVAVEVQVDWNGSGDPDQPYGRYSLDSDEVDSVSINRSYATSLPQELTYLQGNAVSEASVQLSGEAAMDLSPFRTTSPLSSGRRVSRPVVIRVGSAGHPMLDLFTGSVRSCSPRSSDRTATIDFLDLPVEWRAAPVVPAAAGGGGWLNGQWFIDEMLRQTGTFTSPPNLSGAVLAVSMHGSANPQTGTLAAGQYLFDPFIASPFAPGVHGMSIGGQVLPVENRLFYARFNPEGDRLSFASGQKQQYQFWARTPFTETAPAYLFRSGPTELDTDGLTDIRVLSTGQLQVTLTRKGQTAVQTLGPVPTGSAAWRFYGVHVTWGATTATVVCRTGSATTTATVTVGAFTAPTIIPATPPSRLDAHASVFPRHESLQVTTGQDPDWSQAGWVAQAGLEVSKLWLDATPPVDYEKRWDVVTALAEAEFATAEFTEQGRFLYRTADRWAQVTTPNGTITADDDIMDLISTESVDAVRNQIFVGRTILSSKPQDWDPPADPIFTTAIRPKGTYTFLYDFEQPVLSAKFSGAKASNGQTIVPDTNFGNTPPDEPEARYGNITAVTELVGETSVRVTLTNTWSNEFRYLANTAVLQAQVFTSTVDREAGQAIDDASVQDYGLRPYNLPDSPWRQSLTSAQTIAADLLRQLRQPLPILQDVPVVYDPRRQLGDRLTVVDPDGLALNRDYWVIGLDLKAGGSDGATQRLTLRPCPDANAVDPENPDPGQGGDFTPASISGLYRWLHAADLTGPDGAAVPLWVDRIGQARFTQATVAAQPRYRTTILNGKPAVQFDGVADFLSSSITLGPEYTVIAVGRSLSTPTAGAPQGIVSADGDGTGSRLMQLRLISPSRVEYIGFLTNSNPTYGYGQKAPFTTGSAVLLTGVRRATQVQGWINGATDGPTTVGTGAKKTRALAIGRSYGLPNASTDPATSGFWNGPIGQVLVWSRALSAGEITQVHNHLADLYGIDL